MFSTRKSLTYLFLVFILASIFTSPTLYAKTIPDVPFFSEDAKVRVSEGKLFIPCKDFDIPGIGFSLELTRNYNSLSTYYGPFGYGWVTNLSTGIYSIDESSLDIIKIMTPIGELRDFKRQSDGSYVSVEYGYQVLIKNPDGTYTITNKNGNKEHLDSNGRLIKKEDPSGNTLTLTYSADKLIKITDSSGRSLNFAYTGDYITKVTDPMGNAYTYQYDDNYNLIKVTNPLEHSIQYQYDYQHNLTKIIYPNNGQVAIVYTDDNKDKVKVKSVTGPDGISRTFKYAYIIRVDKTDETQKVREPFRTLVTDSRGNAKQFLYTTKQKYLSETDPYGNIRIVVRDDRLDLLTETDKNGYTWTYTYDPKGNMLTKISPLDEKWTYTYEPTFNKVKTETDPRGEAYNTIYDYDLKGNLIKVTDAEGNITTYTYYENGLVKTITQPKGNVQNPDGNYTTTFEYDTYGNKTKEIDPLGNETIYTYDLIGRIRSSATPEGNITAYEYDALSQLKKITDAKGNTLEYAYDNMGNLLTLIQTDRTDPQNPVSAVTQYQCSLLGKVTKITDAVGNFTRYAYDTEANLTQTIDAEGNKTTYDYDNLNRLWKLYRWESDTQYYTTQYQYDKVGNQTKIIDSKTNSITYEYDKLNRLSKVIDMQANPTQYQYDKVGNLEYITDANLKTTTNYYDKINRLLKTRDAKGQNTQYEYDKNSNLTKLIDANTNPTQFAYDQLNRLTLTTYPDTSTETLSYQFDMTNKIYKITRTDRKAQAIVYDYDYARRLIKKAYPDTSIVTYAFDGLNRRTDVTGQTGTIHYDYDILGRMTQVIYPGAQTVGYEYYKTGARKKLVYPDTTFITYHYDKLTRLETIKDQTEAVITTYTYDNDLPVIKRKDLLNTTYAAYDYNNLYQLINLSNRNQQLISGFTYDYDKIGNRKYAIHNHDSGKGDVYTYDDIYQVTNVKYNVVDPIAESQNPGSSTFESQKTYNLDYVGNRTSVVNGGTTTYTPNNLNQYASVNSVNYSYDLNGNLTSDDVHTYTYDYDNRLTSVIPAQAGIQSVAFTYDSFGRRIKKEVTQNSVLTTQNYVYDGNSIIAEYDNSNNLIAKYIHGQRIDEVISLTKAGNTYYYHYDGLGSVTDITNSSGALVEKYTYDIYGSVIIKDANNNVLSQSAIGNRYMFTGREYDAETGLYYYRARYYDPSIGRFLQTDPIGYWGGINLYTYVKNNPINFDDPTGLFDTYAAGQSLSNWGGTAMEYGTYAEAMGVGFTLFGQPEIGLPLAAAGAAASLAGLIEALIGEALKALC